MPRTWPAEIGHPILSLINSLTFNIDPTKAGAEAFGYGKSNLPSAAALQASASMSQRISRGTTGGGIFDFGLARGDRATAVGTRSLKVFTFDVETTGLGVYDQVRSLAGSTMMVQESGGPVRQIADQGFSAHFLTPQMEQFNVGSPTTRNSLGKMVVGLERGSPAEELFDLNTAQGRAEAIDGYKKFMKQALEADIVTGHNVQFDFQKVAMSANAIEGFGADREAVDLLKRFNMMADEGRVVNTLDLAKDYLTRQIVADPDFTEDAGKIITKMFAPETLARSSIGGSATPFSIGNISAQTNLLELVESRGGTEGAKLIQDLAAGGSAAHQAKTDTLLTNYMIQFIHTGQLKYGFGGAHGSEVSLARKTILKSSAIVPTTNIADAQHMSDAVFNYARSQEGMKGVKLSTDGGSIISFSKADNEFYERTTDAATGEVKSTKLSQQSASQRIVNALEASRRGEQTELLDVGVNYLEASRADRVLANIGATANVSTTTNLRSLAMGLRAGDVGVEDQLIDSLAATREFLGFQEYGERPEIFTTSGMDRLMSEANYLIDEGQADNYLKRLASAGIETGIDDVYMRRNFVALASATSGIPFSDEVAQGSGSISERIVRRVAGAGAPEEEIAERISDFNARTGKKVGEFLSEFGISFARTQKDTYLFGPSGTVSRPIVQMDILKDIDIDLGDGRGPVKFLSDEFLQDYGVNKFGLSTLEREEGRVVNLVFGDLAADVNNGGAVIRRDIADQLAQGITDRLEELMNANKLEEVIGRGRFIETQQAKQIAGQFLETGGKDRIRDLIKESLINRGLTVGSIEGREGQGVAAIMDAVSSLENDTEAFQRLYQFSANTFGDAHVAFQGRMDDTTLAILEQAEADKKISAGTVQRIKTGEINRESYEAYEATLERAYTDSPFRKRLQRTFARKNLDKGFLGSRVGRSIRDEAVRETYRKVAPKVGMGLAAVGLLSAGYYIARKNKESDLYGETMEQQPTERSSRGDVSYSNNESISTNPQMSTRRDPLATAGVVGNLDRNKINHTRMGPQKYSNLYGG